MRLPLAILVACAFLPACAASPAAAPPPGAPQPAASVPIDPLSVGRKFLFASTRVEGNATERGTYAIEIVARAGDDLTAHVVAMGLGDRPAMSLLKPSKASATAPYAAWTPTLATGPGYDVPADAITRGVEAVTIPAGTFQATKSTFAVPSMRSCCFDKLEVTLWTAEGIGLVKAVEAFTPGTPGGEAGSTPITTTLELVRSSFVPG